MIQGTTNNCLHSQAYFYQSQMQGPLSKGSWCVCGGAAGAQHSVLAHVS